MNAKLFNKIKWIILGALLFSLYITFLYDDIVITYTHSLNFLDCLFSGNFLGFYDYTLENIFMEFPADYYILIYIIFGIWNFPIWVLIKMFGIDPYSVATLLWAKTILLVFIAGVFWTIHKIFEIMEEQEKEHVYFMMSSSLLFVLPVCVMAQYDIISLFFVLIGILQCIKADNVSWKAIIAFAIAIPIKILAVFPVVLIILLKEKRIIEIVKKMFLSMLGLILCILPYIANDGFYKATQYNGGWFDKLSRETIPSGWSGISIFWLVFCVLCILAYCMHQESKKELLNQIVWILSAFYCSFFIFVEAHPQWSILVVPFLVMLIRKEDKNFSINVLLETVANVSLAISQAYFFCWVYCTDTTSWLVMRNVEKISDLLELNSLRIGPIAELLPLINAVYLAAVMGILVINHPWRKEVSENIQKDEILRTETWIDILRILIILGYIIISFMIIYIL